MALYTPLWCKSYFSFLEDASHPDELAEEAHRLGFQSLALTDRDGIYGIVRAYVKARELGLHLIVGAQVTLADHSIFVLLAQNLDGYSNLCRLITTGRLHSPKGESSVTWDEVCRHADDLLALWGGEQSLLAGEADPGGVAGMLREAFSDRLYALLTRHRQASEVRTEARLRTRATRYGLPLVAATEVLYHTKARRPLQDVLTAIRHAASPSRSPVSGFDPTPSITFNRLMTLRPCSPMIRRPSPGPRRWGRPVRLLSDRASVPLPLGAPHERRHFRPAAVAAHLRGRRTPLRR